MSFGCQTSIDKSRLKNDLLFSAKLYLLLYDIVNISVILNQNSFFVVLS